MIGIHCLHYRDILDFKLQIDEKLKFWFARQVEAILTWRADSTIRRNFQKFKNRFSIKNFRSVKLVFWRFLRIGSVDRLGQWRKVVENSKGYKMALIECLCGS